MSSIADRLRENLSHVRQRIAEAERRSGRPSGSVQLVAVTKYVGPDVIGVLVELGCRQIGESRPQDLWRKAEQLRDKQVQWHLVGHLQRNKIKRTIPLLSMLHSGDSLRLLEAVDAQAASLGRSVPVLLEVNISGEPAKHGFAPHEMRDVLPRLAELRHLDIRGLMTIAGLEGGLERARRDFRALRQLRDELSAVAPRSIQLAELSMGMSGDFEVAIEEGATIVRVGSALFEGLTTPGVAPNG